MKNGRKLGISVVEVLVVVAVIFVLAFVVLSVLSVNRRGQGHAIAQCLNNVKGLGLTMTMYANNNHGFYPRTTAGKEEGSETPMQVFQLLMDIGDTEDGRILLCPLDTDFRGTAYEPGPSPITRKQCSYSFDWRMTSASAHSAALISDDPHIYPDGQAGNSINHGMNKKGIEAGQSVFFVNGSGSLMGKPGPAGADDNIFTRSSDSKLRLGVDDAWIGKTDMKQAWE